jgi:galactokinase
MDLPIEQFTNSQWVSERLQRAGLSSEAVAAKAGLFVRCATTLIQRGEDPRQPATAWFVPGRIEVLGKHTDYAGGRSVVAALERGFCCVASPHDDPNVRLYDVRCDEEIGFAISPALVPDNQGWSNYAMTVARRLARNFPGAHRGSAIALTSDLPPAAGMSSSSALMVAIFLLLADINDIWRRPEFLQYIGNSEDLAEYLGTVENGQTFRGLQGDRGVGTFGGSEDHTAILCSRPGHLAQYSYCPVRLERHIKLPEDLLFVIGSSGVVAEKTGAARAKYNRISQLVSQLTDLWQTSEGGDQKNLGEILESPPSKYDHLCRVVRAAALPTDTVDRLLERLQHFREESCAIIAAIPDDLQSEENRRQFGELVEYSQQLGATLLHNQVVETVFLAESARKLGALAASAFGAGFGGSVWALVPKSIADSFMTSWCKRYRAEHPIAAEQSAFFTSGAAPAALRLGDPPSTLQSGDQR